jgi:chaperonin GroES
MKLRPLGDRLIVRAIEEEETTASGIVLPDTAKDKPQKGKVLAVGDGKVEEETGRRTPLDVVEGDEVLYKQYGGTEIKVDGEELLVLRESDVLATVFVGATGSRRDHDADTAPTGSERRASDVPRLRKGVEQDIQRLLKLSE